MELDSLTIDGLVLPLSVSMAKPLSPWIQWLLLGTDLKNWLSGEAGNAYAGWFLILLPLSTLAITFVMMVALGPVTRSLALKLSPFTFALFNLLRFSAGVLAVVDTSYCAAHLAIWLVGDIRGSIYGMYQERNAILVGAVLALQSFRSSTPSAKTPCKRSRSICARRHSDVARPPGKQRSAWWFRLR